MTAVATPDPSFHGWADIMGTARGASPISSADSSHTSSPLLLLLSTRLLPLPNPQIFLHGAKSRKKGVMGGRVRHRVPVKLDSLQGPKKWFATKEGPRQEQSIFSGSVLYSLQSLGSLWIILSCQLVGRVIFYSRIMNSEYIQ